MTSVVFHRTAFSGCIKTAAPRSSRINASAFSTPKRIQRQLVRLQAQEDTVSPAEIESLDKAIAGLPGLNLTSQEAIDDAADVLSMPTLDTEADIEAQLVASPEDDTILLTEDEAEQYQDFETDTKELIGSIKDDYQLAVGFSEEELLADSLEVGAAALEAEAQGAEEGAEGEESLTTELLSLRAEDMVEDDEVFLEELEDDDEDEDSLESGVTVEKILDYVDNLQEKYELEEELQDALESVAATNAAQNAVVKEVDESDLFFADAMPGLEEGIPEYPAPEFKLNFLWMEKNLGLAVDQIYAKGGRSPLTEFFVWPRKDAWEDLRVSLETRPWMGERDKIILLNRATEVINFWQDEDKKTIAAAREAFPDCDFASEN